MPRLPATVRAALAGGCFGAAALLSPVEAIGQEDPPPDTVAPRDTLPADSAAAPGEEPRIGELPGELVGALADSERDTTFAVLADPLRPAPDQLPSTVVAWDRERIRRSNAMHLGELLAEMAPGSVPLRATFFGGPMHLVDGPFGPAALDVRVDGRPLVPLIGAQPDLSQVLLATIDEIRVERRAAGYRIDITTLRRTDRRAYSRIEAGSGDPGLESLRLVFTNGVGGAFAATAGFELLDSDTPASDLQGFSGGVAWLPGGGASGLELQYQQRSFERTLAESRTGGTSRLVLGGRHELADGLQAAAWVGESERELDATAVGGDGRRDAVTQGGAELRGAWDRAWSTLGARLGDGEKVVGFELEGSVGVRATDWLAVDAGGRLGSWDGFSTREGELGLGIRLPLRGLRAEIRAGSGVRGVAYPASDAPADSVEYDALAGGLELRAGSFLLRGRVARQRAGRQVAFGTGFDDPVTVGPEAKVTSFEAEVDAPVVPLAWLLDGFEPIRLRGFFRHNETDSEPTPLYLPADVLRGEVAFEDTFLEGDLEVRLALGLDRREAWLTAPGAGGGAPVEIPGRTSWDVDLGIRIVGVLLFWRYDNVAARRQQDLPGFEFPLRRQVFGVRWTFYE